MANYPHLLKRLFSKDPNIRYAKQIKKGRIKLVKIERMNWWERVKFIWREGQMRYIIFPIVLAYIVVIFSIKLDEYIDKLSCAGLFGISSPILSFANFIFMMILIVISNTFLYRYALRLNQAEWRLKPYQKFESYIIYKRNTPLRRKLNTFSFRAFLALIVLGFGLFSYLVIDAIIDYGGITEMNRALFERCQSK